MKKRFLGIVCLLYSIIIIYVIITNNLKNYLSPNMQVYIKASILPLILMGLVQMFNSKINYKFKYYDLVLLLPLIMLIMSSDGKLTMSFAGNRMNNFNSNNIKNNKVNTKEKKNIETSELESNEEDSKEESTEVEKEIKSFEYDIIDESYFDLANNITYAYNPEKYVGKTVRVRGFTATQEKFIPKGYFAIGKYGVSCCAADAGFVGFIVEQGSYKIKNNEWYEIEGVFEKAKDMASYDIVTIRITSINKIDSSKEEQYVYPCYSYGDGTCKEIQKYNIQ